MKNKMFIDLLPIKTERLLITKTSVNDIDLILKLDKQEITQKFLGGVKNKSREERVFFLFRKESSFFRGIVSSLTVFLNEVPIGFIGLKINEEQNDGEVSYIFDLDFTKRGYCYEAVKEIIDICFNVLYLDSIKADTVINNDLSIRILEKLKFEYVGKKINDVNVEFKYYVLKNEIL